MTMAPAGCPIRKALAAAIQRGGTGGGKEGERGPRTKEAQMAFPARTPAARNWFVADEGRRLWMYPITVEEVDQPVVLAMAHLHY